MSCEEGGQRPTIGTIMAAGFVMGTDGQEEVAWVGCLTAGDGTSSVPGDPGRLGHWAPQN